MLIMHNQTSKALLLVGAIALVLASCDADESPLNSGEEAWTGADAPADVALLDDQSDDSEGIGAADAPADQAAADVLNETSPPTGHDTMKPPSPGPVALRTATFALG